MLKPKFVSVDFLLVGYADAAINAEHLGHADLPGSKAASAIPLRDGTRIVTDEMSFVCRNASHVHIAIKTIKHHLNNSTARNT